MARKSTQQAPTSADEQKKSVQQAGTVQEGGPITWAQMETIHGPKLVEFIKSRNKKQLIDLCKELAIPLSTKIAKLDEAALANYILSKRPAETPTTKADIAKLQSGRNGQLPDKPTQPVTPDEQKPSESAKTKIKRQPKTTTPPAPPVEEKTPVAPPKVKVDNSKEGLLKRLTEKVASMTGYELTPKAHSVTKAVLTNIMDNPPETLEKSGYISKKPETMSKEEILKAMATILGADKVTPAMQKQSKGKLLETLKAIPTTPEPAKTTTPRQPKLETLAGKLDATADIASISSADLLSYVESEFVAVQCLSTQEISAARTMRDKTGLDKVYVTRTNANLYVIEVTLYPGKKGQDDKPLPPSCKCVYREPIEGSTPEKPCFPPDGQVNKLLLMAMEKAGFVTSLPKANKRK